MANKMKQKLETIAKTGKRIALASLASLAIGCTTIKNYVEPRVGVMVPIAAQVQEYKPSFLVGGAYGFDMENEKKTVGIGIEAGLDYFPSSAQYIKTNSLLPRFKVKGSFGGKSLKISPSVGVNVLSEFSQIDIPEYDVHDKVSNSKFGIEFGFGATLFDRVNTNVSYTILPASENVKGMFTATVGYRFLFAKK
jgi:hypothetical protein